MSNYSVTMWDFEGSDNEVGEEVYEERTTLLLPFYKERMAFLEEMIDQNAAKQREEQMKEEAADKERRRADKERRRAYAAQFFPEGWEWPKHHSLATEKTSDGIEF